MTIEQYHRLVMQLLDAEVTKRQQRATRERTGVAEAAAGRLPISAELAALSYAGAREEQLQAEETRGYMRELFAGIEQRLESGKTAGDVSRAVMIRLAPQSKP